MCIAALFIITKRYKQPECLWTDEYIKCIYTMEYNLAIKRNEILVHATIWMKLKNIMLIERSQLVTKDHIHVVRFHLNEMPKLGRCIETK